MPTAASLLWWQRILTNTMSITQLQGQNTKVLTAAGADAKEGVLRPVGKKDISEFPVDKLKEDIELGGPGLGRFSLICSNCS